MTSQLLSLKQYTSALQRQNQAITKQQQTLYRQLQSLQHQNQKLQQYYYQNRQINKINILLRQQNEVKRQEIQSLVKKNIEFQQMCHRGRSKEEVESYRILIENMQAELKGMQNQLRQKDQNIEEYLVKIMNAKSSENKVKQEMQEFKKKYFQQKNRNIDNLAKMKELECQCEDLRYRLQKQQVQKLQNSLQVLSENYQKIQLIILQKQQKARQMQDYITQLQYQCQILNQQFIAKSQYSQQLQYQIQSMQAQLKNKKILGQMSEDAVSMLTQSISKIDLIKQHNRMVETIANIQKQNTNKGNSRERYSYSQCGQNYQMHSLPSKLQMRIQTLKMENQNLIRTLAI